ncbi:uncharacterized protein LOC135840609 [Planococcus citri]|uniref:uncharacterized protein LOC135840609 n=1 Tax=Planococcus citri TaxID=170843 RepID=UPI0031F8D571
MPLNCGTCSELIEAAPNYIIKCCACSNTFHGKEDGCATVTVTSWYKKSPDNKATWKCHSCGGLPLKNQDNKRKLDDGSNNGDISSDDDESTVENQNKVRKISSGNHELLKMMGTLMDKKFEDHLKPITDKLEEMSKSIKSQSVEIGKIEERVGRLEKSGCPSCQSLQNEVTSLNRNSWFHAAQLVALQNYTRKDNIIFTNIPYSEDEDPYVIAIKAAEIAGVSVDRNAIVDCHRLPATKGNDGRPPSFIVKFVNREIKRDIIHEYRRIKPRANCFGGSESVSIYANEHLAPATSALFREAKKQLKLVFDYVRVANGMVYVQNKSSPRINIVSIGHIGELKASAQANRDNQ